MESLSYQGYKIDSIQFNLEGMPQGIPLFLLVRPPCRCAAPVMNVNRSRFKVAMIQQAGFSCL